MTESLDLGRPTSGDVIDLILDDHRRFGISPWTARLLFVLLLMVIPGSQILIYPILWILMPSEGAVGVSPPQAPPAPPG